jgi:hypothetical protein
MASKKQGERDSAFADIAFAQSHGVAIVSQFWKAE